MERKDGPRSTRRFRRKAVVAVMALVATLVVAAPAGARSEHGRHPHLPWWCTSVEDDPHDDDMYPEPKGRLSLRDCLKVTAYLVAGRAYATQYPTAADAEAAGYYKLVPYVEGMGTHHVLWSEDICTFDPWRPQWLQYGGNGPDAPLVGMMYSACGDMPPEGFPGGNDHWHNHEPLCLSLTSGMIVAEGLTDEECAAIPGGGVNLHAENVWMVHAWFIPPWTYKPDVWVGHHPGLGPTPPG